MSLRSKIPKPVSAVLYDSDILAHPPAFLTPLQLLPSPPDTPSEYMTKILTFLSLLYLMII